MPSASSADGRNRSGWLMSSSALSAAFYEIVGRGRTIIPRERWPPLAARRTRWRSGPWTRGSSSRCRARVPRRGLGPRRGCRRDAGRRRALPLAPLPPLVTRQSDPSSLAPTATSAGSVTLNVGNPLLEPGRSRGSPSTSASCYNPRIALERATPMAPRIGSPPPPFPVGSVDPRRRRPWHPSACPPSGRAISPPVPGPAPPRLPTVTPCDPLAEAWHPLCSGRAHDGCRHPGVRTGRRVAGSLAGTVADQSGAILPGVDVTLKNNSTGAVSHASPTPRASSRSHHSNRGPTRDGFADGLQDRPAARRRGRRRRPVLAEEDHARHRRVQGDGRRDWRDPARASRVGDGLHDADDRANFESTAGDSKHAGLRRLSAGRQHQQIRPPLDSDGPAVQRHQHHHRRHERPGQRLQVDRGPLCHYPPPHGRHRRSRGLDGQRGRRQHGPRCRPNPLATRSGTNRFQGSAYGYYRRPRGTPTTGSTNATDCRETKSNLDVQGFRLGGLSRETRCSSSSTTSSSTCRKRRRCSAGRS